MFRLSIMYYRSLLPARSDAREFHGGGVQPPRMKAHRARDRMALTMEGVYGKRDLMKDFLEEAIRLTCSSRGTWCRL